MINGAHCRSLVLVIVALGSNALVACAPKDEQRGLPTPPIQDPLRDRAARPANEPPPRAGAGLEAFCSPPQAPLAHFDLPATVGLDRIYYSLESGFTAKVRCVVRTAAEYDAFRNSSQFQVPPPAVDVDFSNDMILVASEGEHGNTGYDVAIGPTREIGDTLEVVVTTIEPVADVEHDVVITPLILIRVPGKYKYVRWVERSAR